MKINLPFKNEIAKLVEFSTRQLKAQCDSVFTSYYIWTDNNDRGIGLN